MSTILLPVVSYRCGDGWWILQNLFCKRKRKINLLPNAKKCNKTSLPNIRFRMGTDGLHYYYYYCSVAFFSSFQFCCCFFCCMMIILKIVLFWHLSPSDRMILFCFFFLCFLFFVFSQCFNASERNFVQCNNNSWCAFSLI